jgi:dolichol-phosphate mannosyltransferase
MPKVAIVIPAYNEEDGIGPTLKRAEAVAKRMGWEVWVVNDGSTDKTESVARQMHAKIITGPGNVGKGRALINAYPKIGADIIVICDADGTYELELAPKMVELALGGVDVVIGSRFCPGAAIEEIAGLNKFGNELFSIFVWLLTGKRVYDVTSGLRAFWLDRDIHPNVGGPPGLDYEIGMTVRAVKRGYKVVEIPTRYADRIGYTKLHPFRDGFRFLVASLRERFS